MWHMVLNEPESLICSFSHLMNCQQKIDYVDREHGLVEAELFELWVLELFYKKEYWTNNWFSSLNSEISWLCDVRFLMEQYIRNSIKELLSTAPHVGEELKKILCVLVPQSCLTFWDPMDSRPPGSSVCGISQARILECVASSFSRASSQLRGWTQVFCIAGKPMKILYWST